MNETVKKLMDAYESVPYESAAYRNAHPDRLAVTACLAGLTPQPVEKCRVLEIGCASGGNLLPMAEQLPGSTFLGVDLSPRQVGAGAAVIGELGLTNIQLRAMDIMDFPGDAGAFDYVIAHGFYSWVPSPVRDKLLQICRRHLSPRGVAYVSFNTYPGWRFKEMARDMMLYRSRRAVDPMEKVALGKQIVQFVAENTPQPGFYKDTLRLLQRLAADATAQTVLHDFMEHVNEPQHFWRFMEEADANGLAYIGEANDDPDPWHILPTSARQTVLQISQNAVDREQYIDYLIGRVFRGAVLCGKEATGAGSGAGSAAGRIRSLYFSGNPPQTAAPPAADGTAAWQFGAGSYRLSVSDPAQLAVFQYLSRVRPGAVGFSDLLLEFSRHRAASAPAEKTADELETLLETSHGLRILELWSRQTNFLAAATDARPCVTRYTRWQAARNLPLTCLRHTVVSPDRAFLTLILLLDGTRDVGAVETELAKQFGAAARPTQLKTFVRSALQFLAEASLLIRSV